MNLQPHLPGPQRRQQPHPRNVWRPPDRRRIDPQQQVRHHRVPHTCRPNDLLRGNPLPLRKFPHTPVECPADCIAQFGEAVLVLLGPYDAGNHILPPGYLIVERRAGIQKAGCVEIDQVHDDRRRAHIHCQSVPPLGPTRLQCEDLPPMAVAPRPRGVRQQRLQLPVGLPRYPRQGAQGFHAYLEFRKPVSARDPQGLHQALDITSLSVLLRGHHRYRDTLRQRNVGLRQSRLHLRLIHQNLQLAALRFRRHFYHQIIFHRGLARQHHTPSHFLSGDVVPRVATWATQRHENLTLAACPLAPAGRINPHSSRAGGIQDGLAGLDFHACTVRQKDDNVVAHCTVLPLPSR